MSETGGKRKSNGRIKKVWAEYQIFPTRSDECFSK